MPRAKETNAPGRFPSMSLRSTKKLKQFWSSFFCCFSCARRISAWVRNGLPLPPPLALGALDALWVGLSDGRDGLGAGVFFLRGTAVEVEDAPESDSSCLSYASAAAEDHAQGRRTRRVSEKTKRVRDCLPREEAAATHQ